MENIEEINGLIFDKNRTLKNETEGIKFLLVERTDLNLTMKKVSPFLLKNVIYTVVVGDIEKCIKLRNGKLLIQTKNVHQAKKLIQLRNINEYINVDISEHPSLNNIKGVVHCPEFNYISKEEILENLKDQNVVDFKRIKTKNFTDTSLYIFVFNSSELPKYLNVGYEKMEIRAYIPPPLRCMNCLRFGHLTDKCKVEKRCTNCGENFHCDENNIKCDKPTNCINCGRCHHAFSRDCPKLIKEKEIQKMKVLNKVDRRM